MLIVSDIVELSCSQATHFIQTHFDLAILIRILGLEQLEGHREVEDG